jgi:glycosyltransferase involved in cell wall biosynthesis
MAALRSRCLVVAPAVPSASASAGDRRLVEMCRLLTERATVDLVAVGGDDDPEAVAVLRGLGVDVLRGGGRRAVLRALRRARYDLVLVEFWHVARRYRAMVRRWQPDALFAVDTVDLHFIRQERGAALGTLADTPELSAERAAELAEYEAADGVVFVSASERDVCGSVASLRASWVVPIMVVPSERTARRREPRLVFVGNWWHAPNIDGVRWFVREVWPAVITARPDAELKLVGANVWSEVLELDAVPGVEVIGRVQDLGPVYDAAAIAIAPLRYGAGVKGKVCEALAAGVPVVATPVALEGLVLTRGADVELADDAAGMAPAILALLADETRAEAMGRSGRATILEQCSPAVAARTLDEMLDHAVASSRGRDARPRWRYRATVAEGASWVRRRANGARRRLRRRLPASRRRGRTPPTDS